MNAPRAAAAALLVAVLALPRAGLAQYCGEGTDVVVCDECTQRTLGHTLLNAFSARLNEGVAGVGYQEVPAGLLFRLDYENGPPPEGSFVKFPNSWPMKGADSFNRLPLSPMVWQFTWGPEEAWVGARIRLHNFQNQFLFLGFTCNPSYYGGALIDGALDLRLGMRAEGSRNLQLAAGAHLQFSIPSYCTPEVTVPELCTPEICTPRVCVFGHCTPRACIPEFCTPSFSIPEFCTPEISWAGTAWSPYLGIDLTDFLIRAYLVPHVSTDAASIDLSFHTDLSPVVNQISGQVGNSAGYLAAAGAAGMCAASAGLAVVCYPIALPIAYAIVQKVVDEEVAHLINDAAYPAIDKAFGALNEPPYKSCEGNPSACTCGSTCAKPDPAKESRCVYPAPPGGGAPGNQWLRLAACEFAKRVDAVELPDRVMTLDVPNFDDVVSFDPPYAPTCQP